MKETVTEEKVIEEEREVIICDYCRLFTSEEVDEEFGEILLNPSESMLETGTRYGYQERHGIEGLAKNLAHMDSEEEIAATLRRTLVEGFEAQADICPNCQEDLFGDGPASMRRDADVEVNIDG